MSTQEIEIPKHYQPQFTTIQELLLQKMGSTFRPYCMPGSYKGESGEVVKQFGATKARVGNEDRNGDTPIMTTPRDQRWVYPTHVDIGDLFDKQDQIRQLIDPTSSINQAFNAAMGRAIDDDIIIPAFFGDAKTGKNGSVTTVFPNDGSQDVAQTIGSDNGATNVGLNSAKIIRGRKLLRRFKVKLEQEQVYVGISSAQEEDLLNDAKYTDRDFGEPVLEQGRLKRWLGCEFVIDDGLPWAANVRSCPMWVKSGMHFGTWEELNTKIGPDPGKKFNVRVYMSQNFGCTRTQEKKVIRILCKDTDGLA